MCILKWLDPLSEEGRDSCPLCRKPVLGPPDPDNTEYQRHVLRYFEAAVPDDSHNAKPRDQIDTRFKHAQELYEDICYNLITVLEEMEEPEQLLHCPPHVLLILNCQTWERFDEDRKLGYFQSGVSDNRPGLARRIHAYFDRHMLRFAKFNHSDNAWALHWALGMQIAQTKGTPDRMVDCCRRIREAHTFISYRLRATLEPDNVENGNIEERIKYCPASRHQITMPIQGG